MGEVKKPFDEWLFLADDWWDQIKGDSAYDYPHLPWEEWYAQGLGPEEAAGRADAELYGYAFDAGTWPMPREGQHSR